jgi:hypothetical protein
VAATCSRAAAGALTVTTVVTTEMGATERTRSSWQGRAVRQGLSIRPPATPRDQRAVEAARSSAARKGQYASVEAAIIAPMAER